jgi:branched-chain amino acid transport system substrate-binding protein
LLSPARRRLAILSAIVLVGGVPVLTGCTKTASGPRKASATITIGLLAAATGDNAAGVGRPAAQGAELAVDIVNTAYPGNPLPFGATAGLSDGSKLALVTGDTSSNAAAAGQATDELVRRSHPVGLVVADSADVVQTVGQKSEDTSTPLIDAYSSADFLGQLGRQWYFRIGPTDTVLLSTALDALHQAVPAGRRLVILDGATGKLTAGAADPAQFAQTRGFTVAGRVPVTAGSTAAADLADKVGALKPDAIVAALGSAQEATTVGDAAQRLKNNVPVVAVGHGPGDLGGPAARGIMRTADWSSDYAARNPVARWVADLYQKRFGSVMNDAAATTFTAVLTLALAIDSAGAANAAHIRAALSVIQLGATEMIMPWNGLQFDTSGQNLLASGLVEQRVGNTFQIVYPRELAARGANP